MSNVKEIDRYLFCQRCGIVDVPHLRCPDRGINPTEMVRASDHDATVSALRAELERVRGALRKYGDHFPECAVIQECGMAVKPPCNCGYAALTPKEPV